MLKKISWKTNLILFIGGMGILYGKKEEKRKKLEKRDSPRAFPLISLYKQPKLSLGNNQRVTAKSIKNST